MNDWPFGTDADRNDPLTKLRIPVINSFNPEWGYVAAYLNVDPSGESDPPWPFASSDRPTDIEAAMLASFIQEYLHYWFHEGYRRRLAQRALDVDSGCNTVIFIKYGPDDWGYRRRSWTHGPAFVPQSPNHLDRKGGPLTLEQVMDHCHTITDKPIPHWLKWKAAHPDIFEGDS